MITGRYPHAVGVPTNNHALDRSAPTLADRLRQRGYRTTFIGKWHLGGSGKPEWSPRVDGGFEFKQFMFNRGHWKKFVFRDGNPAVGPNRRGIPTYDVDAADSTTFSTDWLTDRAIDFMGSEDDERPFLTVVSYPDPHGPNTVRSPYDTRFNGLPFRPPRTYKTGEPQPKWLNGGKNHPVFRGPDMARYFGMVQCIDDNIGRILESLEESGRLDQTLIVLTSDHGDLCYEHDRLNKGNPYEGSARVPMIFRFPRRIPGGEVYLEPIGTVDLTPTLMGLMEFPATKGDQGRDLSAVLGSTEQLRRTPTGETVTFLRNAGTSAGWVAAIDDRFKLILSVNDIPWLFDARLDPDELKNFCDQPESAGTVLRLARALNDYGKRTADPHFAHPRIRTSLDRLLSGNASD